MLVLGLGSNLGDRETHLKRAVNLLARGPDAPLTGARLSRVYTSDALVPDGAPEAWRRPFLNCALVGETTLDPEALLRRVKQIERTVGREAADRWAPRVIDIDILWWSGVTVDRPELQVPHPGLLERSFVLEPLRDLVPDAVHEGASFREHAARVAGTDPRPAGPSPESDFRVRWPRLMGILNVTPDSFSDGGRFTDAGTALAQAERLLDGGAEILDVGAESTRPDGVRVPVAEERARLRPVLDALQDLRRDRYRLSLDSRNPETVSWALERGVDIVNDVTGFADPALVDVVSGAEVDLVCMHSLSVPVVKWEFLPEDRDPVEQLAEWGRERLEALRRKGIPSRRVYFDPGIGFGKTTAQNWTILSEVERLHSLGAPLLVGHSRKSFFRSVTDRPAPERDEATVEVSLDLARRGVEVLRVHDPAAHTRRFREEFAREGDAPSSPVGAG
ncbi:MAG: dihydropteroate synthase [Gemmatimonadota bacterium]|nr:dihydropteroate synthase [Gemmatimonadota bacterium]